MSFVSVELAEVFYRSGKTICVQRPSRCIWIFDEYNGLWLKSILSAPLAGAATRRKRTNPYTKRTPSHTKAPCKAIMRQVLLHYNE